jgi:hypothetical protein
VAAQVTDAQISALRAFLMRDLDATTQLTAGLNDADIAGYHQLAEAALSVMAVRQFPPTFTSADVVRFIASVRVSRLADGGEYDFDPVTAENVLRYALGQQILRTPDAVAWFGAVIALLGAFADSELSNQAELDALLSRARNLADQWLAGDPRLSETEARVMVHSPQGMSVPGILRKPPATVAGP